MAVTILAFVLIVVIYGCMTFVPLLLDRARRDGIYRS
jgi:hypothetical protein